MDLRVGWREFPPNKQLNKYAIRHYEKIVYRGDDVKVGVNVYEYGPLFRGEYVSTYEVDVQIPDSLSVTGRIITIKMFPYTELDLEKMEFDGIVLIICNSVLEEVDGVLTKKFALSELIMAEQIIAALDELKKD